MTRALLIPELSARTFMQSSHQPNPHVLNALRQEHLLHQESNVRSQGLMRRVLLRQSTSAPSLIICCGYLDLYGLMAQLNTRYDFVLPGWPEELSRECQLIPLQQVQQQIHALLQGLKAGLKWLQSLSFQPVLHDLPPASGNDQDFQTISGFFCPWEVRTKLTLLFNQGLKDVADDLHLNIIELWSYVSDQHRLKAEYLMDGIHLNRRAAELSLQLAWEQGYLSVSTPNEDLMEYASGMECLSRNKSTQPFEVQSYFCQQEHLIPEEQTKCTSEELRLYGLILLHYAHSLVRSQEWQKLLQTFKNYAHILKKLEPAASLLQNLKRGEGSGLIWLNGGKTEALQVPEGISELIILHWLNPVQYIHSQELWQRLNPDCKIHWISTHAQHRQQVLEKLAQSKTIGWQNPLDTELCELLFLALNLDKTGLIYQVQNNAWQYLD